MLSSTEMSQLLVGCPLCCQATFSSTNALCVALITVASKTLKCPICEEVLCGLDKLTIHLLNHLLTQSRDHCINKVKNKTMWHALNNNVKKSNEISLPSTQFIYEHDKCLEAAKNKFCITEKLIDSSISEENINKPIEDIIQAQKIVVGDEVMLVFDKTNSQHKETNEYVSTNLLYNAVSLEDPLKNTALDDSHQYNSSLVSSNAEPVQYNFNSEMYIRNLNSKSIASILPEPHTAKDYCIENKEELDNLEHLKKDEAIFRDTNRSFMSKFGNSVDLLGSVQRPDGLTNSLSSIDKTKVNFDDSGSDISVQKSKAGYHDNFSSNPVNEQVLKVSSSSLPGLECEKCSVRFIDHKLLSMHQVLAHSNENFDEKKKTYSCKLCTKSFKMKGSLIVHTKVAHSAGSSVLSKLIDATKKKETPSVCGDVSPYACVVCGKGFRKEQHLVQHEKTHEGKQWECDFCGKTFTTKYFLKKHHLLHTGETPYTCTTCNKSFTFQQSYHKHLLYHSDDKPYQCNECGRSFKELSTLHNHQRIHTGEKPYSCETCGLTDVSTY